ENGALHRRDDGIPSRTCSVCATRPFPAAAGELGERGLGTKDTNLETAPVALHRAHGLAHGRADVTARNRLSVVELRGSRRHQLRLDEPVTRLALDEAGMGEQSLVEA